MERTTIKSILLFVVVMLICSCTIMVMRPATPDTQTDTASTEQPSTQEPVILCNIPNEIDQGECVAPADCVAYGKIKNESNPSPVELENFIQQIQCNISETMSLVCCPRNSEVYSWTYMNETVIPFNQSATVVDSNSCGLQASMPNIIGGKVANIDEFPWMALLWYQGDNNKPYPGCGGALISRSYVITAAHCATKETRLNYVRLREYNINTNPDCVLEDCSDPVLDLEPKEIILHPEYDDNSRNLEHDIALIRIDQTPPFSDFLRSICLPERNFEDGAKSGTKLVASGWGRTDIFKDYFGSIVPSPIKLKLSLPYVERDTCKKINQMYQYRLGPGQMCAGGEQGKDTCYGDSGSPLMNFERKYGRWHITGIVSRGVHGCADKGVPAVYTNVYHYLPWIKNITGL